MAPTITEEQLENVSSFLENLDARLDSCKGTLDCSLDSTDIGMVHGAIHLVTNELKRISDDLQEPIEFLSGLSSATLFDRDLIADPGRAEQASD